MTSYTLFTKHKPAHYIYIDLVVSTRGVGELFFQLPAWRPGRYEPGNFARNIKKPEAFDNTGRPLSMKKTARDRWHVICDGTSEVKVTYSYFAAEMTAGSCFSDDSQMYVNPVHCCMYVDGRENEPHEIKLQVPAEWRVCSPAPFQSGTIRFASFDELADSPFFAAANVVSDHYVTAGKKFHLHFNGICRPDTDLIKRDFAAFTKYQVDFWGDFPQEDFHFLFQILPYRYYHGVEHSRCTVIVLGPGYALNSGDTYEDFLGVSSHELFHVWNVKTIRPAEMLPYDFTRENFARTGFVYEGFTTYYGDKSLLASGVFNERQYFKTLEERLQRHFHNYGRYNLSVADSSWDTWIDGYVPGAPYRKTSIYDEGCLVAFMLDVLILKQTDGARSLRDVCRLMYERFGKKSRGYTEADIVLLVSEVAGKDLQPFFDRCVFSPADFSDQLAECFAYLGLAMKKNPSGQTSERLYGFKTAEGTLGPKISSVASFSPAWKAGLFVGDEIVGLNGVVSKNNLNHWLAHFAGSEISVTYASQEMLKETMLVTSKKGEEYFFQPEMVFTTGTPGENFSNWLAK
jgi:predicted metalloprotease with PDZ domain